MAEAQTVTQHRSTSIFDPATRPAVETFHFLRWGFDITKLRGLLAASRTKPRTTTVSVAQASRLMESDPRLSVDGSTRVPLVGVEVDWSQVDALDLAALEEPLFVAPLGNLGDIVIDGWHRLALARRHGVDELPGIVLTRRRTQQILLPRSAPLPPPVRDEAGKVIR